MIRHLRPPLRPLPSCRTAARQFSLTPIQRLAPVTVNSTQKLPWFTSIPSFRQQIARTSEVPSFAEKVKCPSIKNQILFFVFGSTVVFFIAARITNEETYDWSVRLCTSAPAWQYRPPTNDEMRRARYYSLGKTLQDRLGAMKDAIEEWPETIKSMLVWTYIQVAQPVLDTTESRRVCWAISAVSGMIYVAWQFPQSRPYLRARFTHSPLTGLSYTMLTSLFSHRHLLHVWLNSLGLAAFGSATAQRFFEEHSKDPDFLREASPKWHFIAFFISAGLFSNLVAHVAISQFTFPRLVSRLKSSASTASSTIHPPSRPNIFARFKSTSATKTGTKDASSATIPLTIGATGAVYSAFTVVALAYPDTELALKIPPTFPLPIQWGLGALLAVDVLGLLRGWRLFNHWAHLGGAAFGAFYWEYGPVIWEVVRELTLGGLPPSLCHLPEESLHENE